MVRNYRNSAIPQILMNSGGIDDSDTVLEVSPGTDSYPEPPFAITVDRGTADEEVMLVVDLDSGTFTVERAFDNSVAVAHAETASVEHTSIALDFREAGIARVDETERDDLDGENLWEGRVIYNTDRKELEVNDGDNWVVVSGFPAGFGGLWFTETAPDGFLLCRGQSISSVDYPDLYAVIGTVFGGDGSPNFNLPDLRQRFPLGQIPGPPLTGSVLGDTGGAIDHTHTGPSHNHGVGTLATASDGAHAHTNPDVNGAGSHDHGTPDILAAGDHNHSGPSHTHSTPNHTHSISSSGAHTHTTSTATAGVRGTDTAPFNAVGAHSHTISSSGSHTHTTTSGGGGTTGSGGTGNTSTNGSHTHNQSNSHRTTTVGNHVHSQGNTGSAGAHTHALSGSTANAGTGNTGVANPPFLVVNFIISVGRVAA